MNKNIIDTLLKGDAVSCAIAILLLFLSIITWIIFIYKYLVLNRLGKNMPKFINEFWDKKSLADGINYLQNKDAEYSGAIVDALNKAQNAKMNSDSHQSNLPLSQTLNKYLRINLQKVHYKIHTGHNFLATVGSTSPFIGLFGTVWGIYHALNSIATQGQVSIDKIAGPVGEALIMTAFGLLIALPAVVAYNILSKKAKFIYQYLDGFAKDISNLHNN